MYFPRALGEPCAIDHNFPDEQDRFIESNAVFAVAALRGLASVSQSATATWSDSSSGAMVHDAINFSMKCKQLVFRHVFEDVK
jgi:hypothetical protein